MTFFSDLSPSIEQNQLTILIVDDMPANIGIVMNYLKDAGFRILVALDGETAISTAEEAHPDLILLDVMMPGMNGFETCTRLKARDDLREIPVIFASALSDTVDKLKGFQAGGLDYITKPFQVEEVLVRIQTHLGLSVMKKRLKEQNEHLKLEITAREKAETLLHKANTELEDRVAERTIELSESNRLLQTEISERLTAEKELMRKNEELGAAYEELAATEEELRYQYRELQEKQIEIQITKDQYRNVVEDQTEFICRFKPDRTIIFVNGAFCRNYSVEAEEVIGKVFTPRIPPPDKERLRLFFASLTSENPIGSIEHQVILPSGEIRWQEWSERVIFNEMGEIAEYQSVGRDITSRKELQELNSKAFQQIEKNIDQFAILNDQIRNPLTVLLMLTEDLNSEKSQLMEKQIKNIDGLVDQLDKGLIKSEKVQTFLRKHYQI